MNTEPSVLTNGNGTSEARHLPEQGVLAQLIGNAPGFADLVSKLPMIARTDGTVLITGETGTGKEIAARALHQLSSRASAPFIAVNCGSLVDTLLESELFGHERGAFTDAHARRVGLLTHARAGTLFLDEAETLTPRAQVALLRVIQERTFRPVGSASEQHVEARFIAATNASLDRLVQEGQFRRDLYYRLCVFSVTLPALRERREDILPLAAHFLTKHYHTAGPAPRLSIAATEALLAFEWPGNIRELESAIIRAVHVARDGVIEAAHLGLPVSNDHVCAPPVGIDVSHPYKIAKRKVVEAFDREYLVRLLAEHQGNVSRAAEAAGKERRDFGKLLKRYGLEARQFATLSPLRSIASGRSDVVGSLSVAEVRP
jgi:two-component system, NtrC family, response regulator GlrR